MYRYLLLIIIAMSFYIAQTTISVLDFNANGISAPEALILTDRFRAELIQLKEYSVIETPASYSINQIISVKYDYLKPERRKKEYGKIIGKSIRKIILKKDKRIKNNTS